MDGRDLLCVQRTECNSAQMQSDSCPTGWLASCGLQTVYDLTSDHKFYTHQEWEIELKQFAVFRQINLQFLITRPIFLNSRLPLAEHCK